jgi:hypothetical protein
MPSQLEEQRQRAEDDYEARGKSLRGLKAVDEDEAAFLDQMEARRRRAEQQRRQQLEAGLGEWEAGRAFFCQEVFRET